jgi:hypothetical protein
VLNPKLIYIGYNKGIKNKGVKMANKYEDTINKIEYTDERIKDLQEAMLLYHGELQSEGLNDVFEPEMTALMKQFPELLDVSVDVFDSIIDRIYGSVKNKLDMLEVRLPFTGYYETINNDALSQIAEMELGVDENEGMTDEQEKEYDNIDWSVMRREYAEEYTKVMADELGINIVYGDMESPREYNFETDKIFAHISILTLKEMYEEVKDTKEFKELVLSKFTNRDGFKSNYSNNIEDWGNIVTWDHNQLYTVVSTYLESNVGLYELENTVAEKVTQNGSISITEYKKEDKNNKNDIPH